ncbi:MAG TPA: DUF4184 family protein [Steroidobacteraceae bacterium]
MPFTVSHVAAVLPFYRRLSRWGVLSAAIIGSMVPDFDFFLPIRLTREQTHGFMALFTFCLPAGLATWLLFQVLIKPAVSEVLPTNWYARLSREHGSVRLESLKGWVLAAVAVLGGALTHIVWDGYTHEDGRGVRMLPFLGDTGPDFGVRQWPWWLWLQHGSSVIGLLIVVGALLYWVRTTPLANGDLPRKLSAVERRIWVSVYLLIPATIAAAEFLQLLRHHARLWSANGVGLMAIVTMDAIALSLVITSAMIRRRLLGIGHLMY